MVNIKDISEELAVSFFRVCNGKVSEGIYKHTGLSQIIRADQSQFVIIIFLCKCYDMIYFITSILKKNEAIDLLKSL
jgi:hypothetical protein